MATDSAGNVYVADCDNNRVEKITPAGGLTVIAGSGAVGDAVAGPATSSPLDKPCNVAVDGAGNVYIADTGNDRIEKVTPSGVLSIIAGLGYSGFPKPGPATSSAICGRYLTCGLAADAAGDVFVVGTSQVYKINTVGQLSWVAGNLQGGPPVPGPATSSPLGLPSAVAVDASGNLYIADAGALRIEKVTPAGVLSIVAGNGKQGSPVAGPALSSSFDSIDAVAVDSAGNLYATDDSDSQVVKITTAGQLSIVAGSGSSGPPVAGRATSSPLESPAGIAIDNTSGSLYIATYGGSADYGRPVGPGSYRIAKVTADGQLSIFAGTGNYGPETPGPGSTSLLSGPYGVAVDAAGNVYVADRNNYTIDKITPAGTLSIVAGTGNFGSPVAGPATKSPLNHPDGVAVDSGGNLYIADEGNSEIEKVTPAGQLSIVAGTGTAGVATAGPASKSSLNYPTAVAVDSAGDVYVADAAMVEKITPAGALSIVAGDGSPGNPTEGPAASSELVRPVGLAVDSSGNLYITDAGGFIANGTVESNHIERISPTGTLSLIGGVDEHFSRPCGVAVDRSGNLYVTDCLKGVVQKITPAGTFSTVVGNGTVGLPTVGPALGSALNLPVSIAVDPSGNLYIGDHGNNDVEKVTFS